MQTERLNPLNITLILVCCACAHAFPYQMLLIAYAVLGPAHYLTEISWLHERHYFAHIPAGHGDRGAIKAHAAVLPLMTMLALLISLPAFGVGLPQPWFGAGLFVAGGVFFTPCDRSPPCDRVRRTDRLCIRRYDHRSRLACSCCRVCDGPCDCGVDADVECCVLKVGGHRRHRLGVFPCITGTLSRRGPMRRRGVSGSGAYGRPCCVADTGASSVERGETCFPSSYGFSPL